MTYSKRRGISEIYDYMEECAKLSKEANERYGEAVYEYFQRVEEDAKEAYNSRLDELDEKLRQEQILWDFTEPGEQKRKMYEKGKSKHDHLVGVAHQEYKDKCEKMKNCKRTRLENLCRPRNGR